MDRDDSTHPLTYSDIKRSFTGSDNDVLLYVEENIDALQIFTQALSGVVQDFLDAVSSAFQPMMQSLEEIYASIQDLDAAMKLLAEQERLRKYRRQARKKKSHHRRLMIAAKNEVERCRSPPRDLVAKYKTNYSTIQQYFN